MYIVAWWNFELLKSKIRLINGFSFSFCELGVSVCLCVCVGCLFGGKGSVIIIF